MLSVALTHTVAVSKILTEEEARKVDKKYQLVDVTC